MQSPGGKFYFEDEESRSETPVVASPVSIVVEQDNVNRPGEMPSYINPANKKLDHLYYVCTDCVSGAMTPESKNSSNASLLSRNATIANYSGLDTKIIKMEELLEQSDMGIPAQKSVQHEESLVATSIQVFIAFMVAGFGNVGAGLILDHVQYWSVFVNISAMFVLVPSLLGLKGNLEMTLAARLSTQANLGNMDAWRETVKMAKGNIALVQCQATVVSFLAAILAIGWSLFNQNGSVDLDKVLIMFASALVTANIACLALGACMICVVIFSHKINIDPDNIATPIAASLGDVTTAALLAAFSQLIYNQTQWETTDYPVVATFIVIVFLVLLPIWFYLAWNNEYTRDVVLSGWYPVILAMIISSFGGFILDYGVLHYDRIALFQPVINGVGGNLVAVQASRISTSLHRLGKPGVIPFGFKTFISPIKAFFDKHDINVTTARILFCMAIPAQITYVIAIRLIEGPGNVRVTPAFLSFYMFVALLQVALLLYFAYFLVRFLWKKAIDPDNSAIPILTASGDFLGTAFLLVTFTLLSWVGDPNAIKSTT